MSEAIARSDAAPAPGANRRLVLKSSLTTLAAVGAASFAGSASSEVVLNDRNILNFALNLEYLEAEFYMRATTGQGLSDADATGGDGSAPGTVKGGAQVQFTNALTRQFAQEIAFDELAHARFIRSALGSNAVARPDINFTDAFNTLAAAAGLGNSFDAFANETNFLIAAFMFEDVDVTALSGAAPAISDKGLLASAAGILAVEGYHAGTIRTMLLRAGQQQAANAISSLRDRLDGNPRNQDQGIRVGGSANFVPADRNGIAFKRTPSEVLGIVYAGGASGDFGFFPNKVNGAIK